MAREGGKEKVTASVDSDILAWARSVSGPGKRFSSTSHAIEYALFQLRDQFAKERK